MIGAALIAKHTPLPKLFLMPLVALLPGSVAALLLLALCRKRFHGLRLSETAAASTPAGG
jgi:hypothetical protein